MGCGSPGVEGEGSGRGPGAGGGGTAPPGGGRDPARWGLLDPPERPVARHCGARGAWAGGRGARTSPAARLEGLG